MLPKISSALAVNTISYQNNLGSNSDGSDTLSDRIEIKVKLEFKESYKTEIVGYSIQGNFIIAYYIEGDLDINVNSIVYIINNNVEENYKVLKVIKSRDPYNGDVHFIKLVIQ